MISINIYMVARFRGFSTADRVKPPYTLRDLDLVKQDLLNVFYTRKGERVMRPEYGTIIWDLLMDPSDSSTEKEIRQDISRIVNADPRVEALGVDIFIMDHVIRIEISLNYVLLNTQDILYLEYIDDIKGTEF